MKSSLRLLALFALLLAPNMALATNMADVVKAQVILSKVLELAAKYQESMITVVPPQPRANAKGRYLIPYTENGALTEWANKTLNVQLGAAVGEKGGELAAKGVASRVPFGGMASGFMKKKGKEMGAIAALGGLDYIKSTSSMSFDSLDDYAVYLHFTHSGRAGYDQALAAAMAIYPELEKDYNGAIKNAYRNAKKAG